MYLTCLAGKNQKKSFLVSSLAPEMGMRPSDSSLDQNPLGPVRASKLDVTHHSTNHRRRNRHLESSFHLHEKLRRHETNRLKVSVRFLERRGGSVLAFRFGIGKGDR